MLNNILFFVVPKLIITFVGENIYSFVIMCQTMLISDSIVSLSKRSFARRLRAVSARVTAEKSMLTRLNNQLDDLYELLYDNYPSMTAGDYDSFKEYLHILLDTLQGLCEDYQRSPYRESLADSIARLCSNRMAIEEIDNDIRNFKIRLPHNPRYAEVMAIVKSL